MLDVHAPGGRGAAALVVAALVVAAGVPAATAHSTATAAEVSGCQTIDSPGIYEVTANLTDAPADGCIVVAADNVVLSGNGHRLAAANGTGPAVLVTDAARVSVSGLVLDGWETGVAYRGVDGGGVLDVTVTNASTGVSLADGTADVTVDSVTVTDASTGVSFAGAGHSVLSRSTVAAPNGTGVAVTADDTAVVGNEVTDARTGVRVTGARGVEVARNTVSNATTGIAAEDTGGVDIADNTLAAVGGRAVFVDGDLPPQYGDPPRAPDGTIRYDAAAFDPVRVGHEVTNNTIAGGNDYGVLVVDAADATVAGNTVTDTEDGIGLGDTEGVRVADNTIDGVGDDGVHLANANHSVVAGNEINDSGNDAVYAVGYANRVANNTLTNATDDGVDVQDSNATVLAGNRVVDSGDDAVFLRNAHGATVSANHLVGSGDDGVDLRGVTRSTVVDNRLCSTGEVPVVQRRGAADNTVANNTVGC